MKVSFTSNEKPHYKLFGNNKYLKMPEKLSDVQVNTVNTSRQLPKDLYVKTNEAYSSGRGFYISSRIKIVKYENRGKDLPMAKAKLMKTLPEGYKLQNYKNNTYLTYENTDIKKKKKNEKALWWVFGSVISLAVLGFIKSLLTKKIK